MVGIYMTTSVFVNEMLIPWADALHLRIYTCATNHFRRVVDKMAAFGQIYGNIVANIEVSRAVRS
jgi:hypothetical protein